ncbi:MAG TPA: hypothetical protein VJN90_13595 [Candidatus Acidoferrales bacterium]|nr:hypothetical protein [Candidatus Acidoferrales bacterium]
MNPEKTKRKAQVEDSGSAEAHIEHPDLQDPKVVLSLLEADQVVAAKTRSRFGTRNLSVGARVLLWSLRVYVLIMLVIVVLSVIRAVHMGQ